LLPKTGLRFGVDAGFHLGHALLCTLQYTILFGDYFTWAILFSDYTSSTQIYELGES